jgi:hypothetical protein
MQKSRLNHASSSMRRRAAVVCAAALAWSVLATSTHAAPPTYREEPVGLNATGLSGYDMNESLTIVGRSLNAQQVGRAFVAVRGEEPTLLPTPAEWQRRAAADGR